MTSVAIRIPMPLRGPTAGADKVTVTAGTVGNALRALGAAHPGVLEDVLGPDSQARQFVNIVLGERCVSTGLWSTR